MLENHRIDIVPRVHINAPHQMDELPPLSLIMAAILIYSLSYKL